MTHKKTLVRIEYYNEANEMFGFKLHEISYFATKRDDLKRACNEHYRKDKNRSQLMIYKINDSKGKIIKLKHL